MRLPAFLAISLLWLGSPASAGEESPTRLGDGLRSSLPPLVRPEADPALFPGEPPPDARLTPWSDWAEGQDLTPLRRIAIEAGAGVGGLSGGGWNTVIDAGGTALCLRGGYCPAPFLCLTAEFSYLRQRGRRPSLNLSIEGQECQLYSDDLKIQTVALDARLRFPFTLIGPALFRFSKAETGTGFAPFIRLGLGATRFGRVGTTVEWEATGATETQTLIASSTRFEAHIGLGLQLRWSWGGMSLEYVIYNPGMPEIAWKRDYFSGSGGGSGQFGVFTLGIGVYF